MTTTRTGRFEVTRCPDCGQRLGARAASECALCGFRFHDNRSTSDDTTLYADAYSREMRGWWAMCRWVYLASASRTKHLGLMRASMASRHFERVNLVLLSFGLAVFALTEYGWGYAAVLSNPGGASATAPTGAGWFLLIRASRKLVARSATEGAADLWWNPAQAILAVGFGVAIGWLCLRALLFAVQWGVTLAHRRAYRDDLRMTAALKYGTAWFVPLLVAAGVLLLRPVSFMGEAAGWRWIPSDESVTLVAGVLAGFGATMWWFWSVRLGVAAPADTRAGVTTFYAIGVPLLASGAAWTWRYSLGYVTTVVFHGLNLIF